MALDRTIGGLTSAVRTRGAGRGSSMPIALIVLTLAIAGGLTVVALAQTAEPTSESARRLPSAHDAAGRIGRVNLNAAEASELKLLPRLSPGSVAAIIESRARARFRDWDDFVKRRVIPSFAEAEIKDLVAF